MNALPPPRPVQIGDVTVKKCLETGNFTLLPNSLSYTQHSPVSPDYTNDGQRFRDKPTET